MTNEKAQSSEDEIEDSSSDEDTSKRICPNCTKPNKTCHQNIFSLYCIDAVEHEFRASPLDTSTKKYAKVFTMAYNRALDYKKYDTDLKLMPHALYYPPACMMCEFLEFMPLLEKDKEAYINGKMKFQRNIEQKELEDIESQEDGDDKKGPWKVCGECKKTDHNCHHHLFGEYCFVHLSRAFHSFPSAMTVEMAQKVYLKWYNSALHFHTWVSTSVYLNRLFMLPPPCLKRQMKSDIKLIMKKKEEHMQNNITKIEDSNMNYFGVEVEE